MSAIRNFNFLKSLLNKRHLTNGSRFFATGTSDVIAFRNDLFDLEQKRQLAEVGRIEKIEVRYLGLPEDCTFALNRDISTPYNVAQHLSNDHCKNSALALLDGNVPWDMHRPIKASCTLQLLNFTVADPHVVNKAFWRTCSFMLGAALQEVFKEDAGLQLHSFPAPRIKSGSFVHDIVLAASNWQPTSSELRAISAEMMRLAAQNLKIERLEVSSDMAIKMFKDSAFKSAQLPSILQQSNGQMSLYRMGRHIDISRGPMVASSRFLGKCTIPAVHKLADGPQNSIIYRVQGVALPIGFPLNHVAYSLLEQRAKKLNTARQPNEPFEEAKMQLA